MNLKTERIESFEESKDFLTLRVRNENMEKTFKEKDVMYIKFTDILITVYVKLGETKERGAFAPVTAELLSNWGVTFEKVVEQATLNDKTLDWYIRDITDILNFTETNTEKKLYVLTNKNNFNGATQIFTKSEVKKFAKKNNSDIIILPSSIHELLLLIDEENTDYDMLRNIVKDVNKTTVSEEDLLSYNIYRYKLNEDVISVIR